MRKFFQSEWLNISFSSFHTITSTRLVGSEFYNQFYIALFKRYAEYNQLDSLWRRQKDEIMDWLAASLPDGVRVLSIGCGLGYMESRLWLQHARIELHVQDYATNALKWLRQVLPADRIHDAREMCSGSDIGKFDLIYLCAVDYSLSNEQLVSLLEKSLQALCDGGQLMMISASFLEVSKRRQIIHNVKYIFIWLLVKIGIRQRGQFWGWMRSRKDYQAIMLKAGLNNVTDGFIETPHQRTYWIKGMGQ